MTIITDKGDSCELLAVTCSSSTAFPINMPRSELLSLLRYVAKTGVPVEHEAVSLRIERVDDGFNFRTPIGTFHVYWMHATTLLLE